MTVVYLVGPSFSLKVVTYVYSEWQDELQGSPQKPAQKSQPQTPAKRLRADDEPTTDVKRRRLEVIAAALASSPVASGNSQPSASGSQPRPSQAQRLAQTQSSSQDSQGGFMIQEAQHPSQDESQGKEDTDDGLFSQTSPVTPPASQQRYHLPDNHIAVKYEEPDSPSPIRAPAHQSMLSHSQGDLDVDDILSPVKSRITTLERKKRSLEQGNKVKLELIEQLKREVANLQRANAALIDENATLKVDLAR